MDLSRLGFRTGEPGGTGRETSLLLHTVFQTLRAKSIGPSQVARDLRITTGELNRHVFGLIPTAINGDSASGPRKRPQLTVVTG